MGELSIWTSYYIELTPEEMIDRLSTLGWKKGELSTEHSETLFERGVTAEARAGVGSEFGAYARSRGNEAEQGHLVLWGDLIRPGNRSISPLTPKNKIGFSSNIIDLSPA